MRSSNQLSRREFIGSATAAAALAAAPSLLGQTSHQQSRPNIILLLGDDHRWDALGCAGNAVIQTPELDRLAAEGVRFKNHFATTPICCTSRASIMTGLYAGTHGIFAFENDLSPAQAEQTYWAILKRAGYHIGFVGKYGVGLKIPEQAAFDYWRGFIGQGFYFPNYYKGSPGQGVYNPEGPAGQHLTHIQSDQANEFLKTAPRDKPFCLSVSFKAPHIQDEDPRAYLPSDDTLSLYENQEIPPQPGAGPGDVSRFPAAIQRSESRRRWGTIWGTPALYQDSMKGYYRLVSGIDRAVGSLRRTLEAQGLAENTIIIYSADHGSFHGEHGFAEKWYGHEESVRIPLIVFDPRAAAKQRGVTRQSMTLNIDLAPTILEMAGIARPASMQGRSVSALLRGDDASSRRLWFFEHHLFLKGVPYIWIPSSEGIRTERWKYLRYTDNAAPFEELYDLAEDPYETRNLAGQVRYASVQRALTSYWRTWKESLREDPSSWREPVAESDLIRDGVYTPST